MADEQDSGLELLIDQPSVTREGGEPAEAQPSPDFDASLIEALLSSMLGTEDKRLRVQEELARGGVGAIHVAFDTVLQRPLAKKTLLQAARAQPVLVRSFLREASLTAQLDHPNIVPVHDLGVDEEGQLYFTMKLVQGRTLAELLDEHHAAGQGQGGQKDDPRARHESLVALIEIVARVCDALAFAHSKGVLHCDLKAQNVMVGRFGQVYLMDWGFAQVMRPRPGQDRSSWVRDPLPFIAGRGTDGFAFGTPAYMSPEQALALRDQMDERSDVFLLGSLLYHVIAGRPPFQGANMTESVRLAQQYRFTPLQPSGDGQRPGRLLRIVATAMARRPEDRYQRVEDLQAELQRFLHGGPELAVTPVAAGTRIFGEDAAADAIYLIVSGYFEVSRGGRRVQVLGPGDAFGEGALLAGTRRQGAVVAVTDGELVRLSGEQVEEELSGMKPWLGSLLRALAQRSRDPEDKPGGFRLWPFGSFRRGR
jgi:serine/threonine-protein kinase